VGIGVVVGWGVVVGIGIVVDGDVVVGIGGWGVVVVVVARGVDSVLVDGGGELVRGIAWVVTGVATWVVTGAWLVTILVASAVVWMGTGHSKSTAIRPSGQWIQVVISNPSSAYPAGQFVQFTVPVWLVTVPGMHWEQVSKEPTFELDE